MIERENPMVSEIHAVFGSKVDVDKCGLYWLIHPHLVVN